MPNDTTAIDKPTGKNRKPDEVLNDIENVIGSIDGIAVRDIFRLASLVREYGSAMAGDAVGQLMGPLLDAMLKPPKNPGEPWKGGL